MKSDSEVEFSPDESFSQQATNSQRTAFHVVTLGGLRPNTLYHYRVLSNGVQLTDDGTFRTAPAPGDDRYDRFGFFAIGDGGSGRQEQREVGDQIQRLVDTRQVDLGLYLGDVVYDRGEEENQDPRFFTPYRRIIDKLCWWTTLGNHDVITDNGAPYYRNRVLPEPSQFADATNPERWYSFDFGNAHFVALDSNEPGDRTQKQFLQWDLEQHQDKTWLFVFFHHPPYATPYADISGCTHESDIQVRRNWSPMFERYGVDVAFMGHNHTYQRSQLRRDYFPENKGVYYVVSGGGGGQPHAAALSDSQCNNPSLTQAVVRGNTYHLVFVRVDGRQMTMQAIDEDGVVFDRFELSK
ncbi:MAG: metallophosphoesterase [Acidobacteria bacterium]|nr:metallophosphoesterase [Acidobacteriota bacterium]